MAKSIRDFTITLNYNSAGTVLSGRLTAKITDDVNPDLGKGFQYVVPEDELDLIDNKTVSQLSTMAINKIKEIEEME